MVALPSRSTEVGSPDDAPSAVEGADAQALLGRPPVLHGEDGHAYAALLARVRADVGPRDILEEFWVRDVVDQLWQTLRLRRMKASLVTVATRDALAEVLAPVVDRAAPGDAYASELDLLNSELDLLNKETPAQELAAGWYRREARAVAEVEKVLRQADLSMDVVAAVALRRSLDDVARIERMIVSAEGQGRQDEVAQILQEAFAKRLVAGHRQPAEQDAEDKDQIEPEPERRHRDADDRDEHDEGINPATSRERREDAGRQADHERDG